MQGFSKPRRRRESLGEKIKVGQNGTSIKNKKKRTGPIIFSCCSVSLSLHSSKEAGRAALKHLRENEHIYIDENRGNQESNL